MAGYLGHIPDRHIVLVVYRRPRPVNELSISAVAMTSLVEKPLGEIKVFLLAGGLVKFHKRELNLLMSGHPMAFVGAEDGHHMVSHLDADIQQFTLPGHVVVGYSSLDHVAGAVHLMLVHVVPTLVQAGQSVECVDITILLLRRGELVNPLVTLGLKNRIGIVLEGICHTLKSLVHVGIIEEYARVLSLPLRGILEIADTPSLILDLVDADI